jgi:hypothetical protein
MMQMISTSEMMTFSMYRGSKQFLTGATVASPRRITVKVPGTSLPVVPFVYIWVPF